MSETNNPPGVRVNDRRRFDPDGKPREAADAPDDTTAQATEAAAPPPPPTPEENDEVARLQQELDAARRRIDELARAVQAGERDREEFKKRLTRERERMLEVEKGNVAVSLLEAVDELDLSLRAADESPLAQGVRLIRDGILARLGNLGVERVPLKNRPYDPNLAEAIDMEITGDPDEDQRVTDEVRAAYRLGERVIRAGRVKVAKYIPPAQA